MTTLSHLNFVSLKLTGPPQTRPPTAQLCHRTSPSGVPWPVRKPMEPTSRCQFSTKWMNVYKNRHDKPMKLLVFSAVWMKPYLQGCRILLALYKPQSTSNGKSSSYRHPQDRPCLASRSFVSFQSPLKCQPPHGQLNPSLSS